MNKNKQRALRIARPDRPRVAFVQADANRYHYTCACAVYGEAQVILARAMQEVHSADTIVHKLMDVAPLDGECNPLWVIFQEQWQEEKQQARAHGEPAYDSCGHCLGRIR